MKFGDDPLMSINGESFKFRSNFDITKWFLQRNFSPWSKYLSFPVSLPSTITSQFIWLVYKSRWKMYISEIFQKNGLNILRHYLT